MQRRKFLGVTTIGLGFAGCSSQPTNQGQSGTVERSGSPSPQSSRSGTPTKTPTDTETDSPTETPQPDPSTKAQESIEDAKSSLSEAIQTWEDTRRNSSFSAAITAATTEFENETILARVEGARRALNDAKSNANEEQKGEIEALSATGEFLKWSTRAWLRLFPIYDQLQQVDKAFFADHDPDIGNEYANDLKQEIRGASGVVDRAISESNGLVEIGVPDVSSNFDQEEVKKVKARLKYTRSVSRIIAQELPRAYKTILTYNSGVAEYPNGSIEGAEGDFITSKSAFDDASSSVSGFKVKFEVGSNLKKFNCFANKMFEASKNARAASMGESWNDEDVRKADSHVSSLSNCGLQLPVNQFFS